MHAVYSEYRGVVIAACCWSYVKTIIRLMGGGVKIGVYKAFHSVPIRPILQHCGHAISMRLCARGYKYFMQLC